MAEAKHAGGRPSKYDEAFCDQIVEEMGKGYSLTAFAGCIGVHRETLLNWGKEHPEFFDAIKRAKAARVFNLETGLLTAKDGPTVTSRIFALKNADPEEWREKVLNEHTGNVTVEIVRFGDS